MMIIITIFRRVSSSILNSIHISYTLQRNCFNHWYKGSYNHIIVHNFISYYEMKWNVVIRYCNHINLEVMWMTIWTIWIPIRMLHQWNHIKHNNQNVKGDDSSCYQDEETNHSSRKGWSVLSSY